jgi:hypothetical protein
MRSETARSETASLREVRSEMRLFPLLTSD